MINRRKRRRAQLSVIDDRFEQRTINGQMAVNTALPARLPVFVEFILMAVFQETFAFAVTDLPPPVAFG